jgi:plasmid stability protein
MGKELRIRDMPEELHKSLRIRAVTEGTSLNGLVIDLLRQAMEKHGAKK